jgi:hypothetical protein
MAYEAWVAENESGPSPGRLNAHPNVGANWHSLTDTITHGEKTRQRERADESVRQGA